MKVRVDNCKEIYFGDRNKNFEYRMFRKALPEAEKEDDLRATLIKGLGSTKQNTTAARKTQCSDSLQKNFTTNISLHSDPVTLTYVVKICFSNYQKDQKKKDLKEKSGRTKKQTIRDSIKGSQTVLSTEVKAPW